MLPTYLNGVARVIAVCSCFHCFDFLENRLTLPVDRFDSSLCLIPRFLPDFIASFELHPLLTDAVQQMLRKLDSDRGLWPCDESSRRLEQIPSLVRSVKHLELLSLPPSVFILLESGVMLTGSGFPVLLMVDLFFALVGHYNGSRTVL
jgi:hypothetical protein